MSDEQEAWVCPVRGCGHPLTQHATFGGCLAEDCSCDAGPRDLSLMARALEACATLLRGTHEDVAHTIDAAMEGAHRLVPEDGTTVAESEPLPLAAMTERLEAAAYDHTVREMELTNEDLVRSAATHTIREGELTDHQLRRWIHLAEKALAGAIGLGHDEAQQAIVRLVQEVQRLRAEVNTHRAIWQHQEDPELLDDLIAVDYEARGAVLSDDDRAFFSDVARRAYGAIARLRQENDELRDAYRSAVAKYGSLPTGWQDDIALRSDLLGWPSDDELLTMKADAGDYREFLPPNARFMDSTPEFYTWKLSGYVLRLLEAMGVDVSDERESNEAAPDA